MPVAPLIQNIVYETDGSSREFTRRSATHFLNSRLTRPLFGSAAWIGSLPGEVCGWRRGEVRRLLFHTRRRSGRLSGGFLAARRAPGQQAATIMSASGVGDAAHSGIAVRTVAGRASTSALRFVWPSVLFHGSQCDRCSREIILADAPIKAALLRLRGTFPPIRLHDGAHEI